MEEKEEQKQNNDPKIDYDQFKSVEMRVGEIKSAEKIEDADRLLKLEVFFGDETRQIVSGISEYYPDPEVLVGKKVPFVTNLEPRKIKGVESNGMILAALDKEENQFSLLEIDSKIPPGTHIS